MFQNKKHLKKQLWEEITSHLYAVARALLYLSFKIVQMYRSKQIKYYFPIKVFFKNEQNTCGKGDVHQLAQ